MRVNALIRSNLGINIEGMNETEYAEAAAQAIWLEGWRLKQQAELLATLFGAKKKKSV